MEPLSCTVVSAKSAVWTSKAKTSVAQRGNTLIGTALRRASNAPLLVITDGGAVRRVTNAACVARTADPRIRAELLESVVDYVLDAGLTDLSLRPLAGAVGTSPRTLLYHFGSKEELTIAVVGAATQRQLRLL